ICLSVYPFIHLSIHPSVCLSIRLSVYPSICLSIHPSICLSIHPSICLSRSLSLSRIRRNRSAIDSAAVLSAWLSIDITRTVAMQPDPMSIAEREKLS
ncbi:hypothetical protein T484DRAFT_3645721, partial [Baffinella frigidus]